MAFYSSSSDSVSSSVSSSDSSSEDGHMAVIRRLDSDSIAQVSLPKLADSAPVSMPTECHNRSHKHWKEKQAADQAREVGYEDEKEYMAIIGETDLACGTCPRGKAKAKAQREKRMDMRFDAPSTGLASGVSVRDTIILPAVREISAPRVNATTTTTTTTVPKNRLDSFANIVLPETVPISSAPRVNATTTTTVPKNRLDSFANIVLPETVPISSAPQKTGLSAEAPKQKSENMELGNYYYERDYRRRPYYYYDDDGYYYQRRPRRFWPLWSKKDADGMKINAPYAHELKEFVTENFPAKAIGHDSSELSLSSSSGEDYALNAVDRQLSEKLHYRQGKIDSLLTELKSKSTSPIQPLDVPTIDLEARKHKRRHHHKAGKSKKPRRTHAKGWGVHVPTETAVAATTTTSDYKARPITLDFPNTQLSQLSSKLAFADSSKEQSLRSLLLEGKLSSNLATPMPTMTTDCSVAAHKLTIFRHMAKSHPEFYQLLRDNGLLPILEATPDLALIIPDIETLETITNRVSVETANVLRYHAIIVPVDQPIRQVTDITEYDTLESGSVVQIEKRADCFYINGHHMKSDTVKPMQLFHIVGILSPKQLVFDQPPAELPPPMNPEDDGSQPADDTTDSTTNTTTTTTTTPPPEDQTMTDESTSEDSGSQQDAAATTTTTTTMSVVNVPTTAVTLKGYNKKTVTLNSAIGSIATHMSKSYYAPQVDMKSYTDASFVAVDPATLTFRTYNTDSLFESYQQKKLTDIVRLRSETLGNAISIAPTHQRRLDIGNKQSLTEFSVDTSLTTIKKADLLAGLTEISFPAPGESGRVCVLKCGIQCSDADINTYMSTDESLLLRFKGSVLDTVAVNMDKVATLSSDAHDGIHFLELFTTEERRHDLYTNALDKEAFNTMLLNESKITKFVKKKARVAKKKVGRATRKVLSSGEREAKKRLALKVKTVPYKALPLSTLTGFEATATAQDTVVTITVYDKSFNLLQELSMESVAAKKYLYAAEDEKFAGYVFEPENALGQSLGQGNAGQYVEVKTRLETVSFNFSGVTISMKDAYYAVRSSTLYVLVFDPSGNLVRMVNMLKRTKLIRGLQL